MVEVLVASAFVAGGVMAAARLGHPSPYGGHFGQPANGGRRQDDLPCPWCQAATSENDARCPSCHQRFG
jgi:hypothetical protein